MTNNTAALRALHERTWLIPTDQPDKIKAVERLLSFGVPLTGLRRILTRLRILRRVKFTTVTYYFHCTNVARQRLHWERLRLQITFRDEHANFLLQKEVTCGDFTLDPDEDLHQTLVFTCPGVLPTICVEFTTIKTLEDIYYPVSHSKTLTA